MKTYRVILAPIVEQQIVEQILYVAQDSTNRSFAWETRLRDVIDSLRDGAGYAIDEDASEHLGRTVHKRVFERNHLLHYCVDEMAGSIEVSNFRHAARKPRRGEP